MSRVGEGDISEEPLRSVHGNAPIEVKELVQRLLASFTETGFGNRTTRCLDLVEVSIVSNVDEPARREARVVLEATVTEDMLNIVGMMHGACAIQLVDICATLPIAAMSLANGRVALLGVTQNINTIYHAPAGLGDKLRLVNTSTTIGTRAWSARTEIWDLTHHRLVASATQVKMEVSSPKL